MDPLQEAARGLANLKPARSQILLTVLAVGGFWTIWLGSELAKAGNAGGWLLVGCGLVLEASVVWCWTRAQRDIDLDKGLPTKVVMPNGSSLSMDGRVLASKDTNQNLLTLLNVMIERQPLPEPTGMVGQDGMVLANSYAEAHAAVKEINEQVSALKLQTVKRLSEVLDGPKAEQAFAEPSERPAIPEPISATVPRVGVGDFS